VIYNVDQIYRRTRFGCFKNYGFAVLKVIFVIYVSICFIILMLQEQPWLAGSAMDTYPSAQ